MLDADNAGRFLSGLRRRGQWGDDAPLVQVYGREPAAFLGSAHICADELIPQRLLSPIEVQDILRSAQCAAEVFRPVSTAAPSEPPDAGSFQH
jgi:tRNA pseudouridine55 synthase